MEALKKLDDLNNLYDFYYNLLTDKQKEYFRCYYQEDYTLQEIAENHNVSRSAVYDQLKKVEEHLLNYESKLQLFAKMKKRQELLKQYEQTNDKLYLELLRKLDDL